MTMRVTRPYVPIVHLDLNHWYALGEAHEGRASRQAELWQAVCELGDHGEALFPLSIVHMVELAETPPRFTA